MLGPKACIAKRVQPLANLRLSGFTEPDTEDPGKSLLQSQLSMCSVQPQPHL